MTLYRGEGGSYSKKPALEEGAMRILRNDVGTGRLVRTLPDSCQEGVTRRLWKESLVGCTCRGAEGWGTLVDGVEYYHPNELNEKNVEGGQSSCRVRREGL